MSTVPNVSKLGDGDIKMSGQHLNKSSNAPALRQSPLYSLHDMQNMHAVALTEQTAALSAISRTFRVAIVSIQRLTPSHPPAVSAENMQFVQ